MNNVLEGSDSLSASTDIYTLKNVLCYLTSFYFQIMIKLFFHHKYYFLKFY